MPASQNMWTCGDGWCRQRRAYACAPAVSRDRVEEALASLLNLPSKAGASAQQKMKEAAEAEMKRLSKDIEIEYKVAADPRGRCRVGT